MIDIFPSIHSSTHSYECFILKTRTEEEEERNKYIVAREKQIPCIVCTQYDDSMEYLIMKNSFTRKNEKINIFKYIVLNRI